MWLAAQALLSRLGRQCFFEAESAASQAFRSDCSSARPQSLRSRLKPLAPSSFSSFSRCLLASQLIPQAELTLPASRIADITHSGHMIFPRHTLDDRDSHSVATAAKLKRFCRRESSTHSLFQATESELHAQKLLHQQNPCARCRSCGRGTSGRTATM